MLTATQFAELVARRGDLVRVLAKWTRLDPEDAASDALAAAWRYRATFDPAKATAWSWLLTIAHREAARCARRPREVMLTAEEQEGGDKEPVQPAPDTDDVIDARRTLAAITSFPPALDLVVRGVEQQDAARRLGITDGSFRGQLSHERAKLRRRLRKKGIAA